MRYTTVLFDADDTLLDFRRAERSALHDVFAKYGLRTDAEFLNAYMQINRALWDSFDRGEITKDVITRTRFVRLFRQFDIPLDGARFNGLYLDHLARYGYTLPGAVELCRTLFAEGIRLYIITNGIGQVQKGRFERSGLAPFFEDVFVSEAVGFSKPRPEFFAYVLSAVPERDKGKIIVVGDSLRADIEGGLRAGLAACWCDFQKTNAPHGTAFRVENFAELRELLEG